MKIPEKLQVWIDARKKHHLSHAHIQMARELGMNPRKFAKLANHKQEPWKTRLPAFIEGIYFKRFCKRRPDYVRSIEQVVKNKQKSKLERRNRKLLKRQNDVKKNAI